MKKDNKIPVNVMLRPKTRVKLRRMAFNKDCSVSFLIEEALKQTYNIK